MECVNLSWMVSTWLLGGLIGGFCMLVLIVAIMDIGRR